MSNLKDQPLIERSDDKARASMPHIQRAIAGLTELRSTSPKCSRCRTRTATHLVDTQHTPMAVCGPCASEWRGLNPVQRGEVRSTFARRGLQ